MYQYKLDITEVEEARKDFGRYIEIDFIVKSQTFACHSDLTSDGGLAPSSTFFKMADGKPEQFLFWTSRPVNDPSVAEYVFTEFFAKDGLSVDSPSGQALIPSATAPTKPHKRRRRRFAYQHAKKYDVTKQFSSDVAYLPVEYGILRLENDKECLDSFGVEHISKMEDGLRKELGDLTDLNKPEAITSLTLTPFGLSKMAWLNAQGEFVKGDMMHQYSIIDKGTYTIDDNDENIKELVFEGDKINGRYRLNMVTNQITYLGEDDANSQQ